MAKTEQDHVNPAASGQLVGKGPMTEAEKAEFLRQERLKEASYSAKDYVGGHDEQHRFHFNPRKESDGLDFEEDSALERKALEKYNSQVQAELLSKEKERAAVRLEVDQKGANFSAVREDAVNHRASYEQYMEAFNGVTTTIIHRDNLDSHIQSLEDGLRIANTPIDDEAARKSIAKYYVDDHSGNVYDTEFYKSVKPGPRITRENDHQNSSGNGDHHAPLVGQGAMTGAERTAFLQQARTDEKAYTASMAARDPQHYMYNHIPVTDAGGYSYADHPLSQKIAAQIRYVGDLKQQLHTGQSFSELADLRDLAKTTTTLMNDQATLNGYYGVAEKHAAAKTTVETTQANAAATITAVPATKTPATELPKGAAVNLPPDMVDMMDEKERAAYHAKLDKHVESLSNKHGSKVIATLGLLAASAEAAYATPGPMATKLDAAGRALKDQVVGAIPFSGPAKQVSHGEFKAASGNAAKEAVGYIPVVATIDTAASIFSKEGLTNSAVMVTEGLRSKAAQDIINALPKDHAALEFMQHDKTQAPINQRLAEYQLRFVDAVAKSDSAGAYTASSRLTELAERKLVLQAEWKQSADHFITALKAPDTDWAKLAKNSDIAPQAAIHMAAVNSHYPAAFVEKVDATLAKNLAAGTPISPEMMAITKAAQVSAAHTQVDTQKEMGMAH